MLLIRRNPVEPVKQTGGMRRGFSVPQRVNSPDDEQIHAVRPVAVSPDASGDGAGQPFSEAGSSRQSPQSRSAKRTAQQPESEGSRLRRLIRDEVFTQIDPIKAATTERENLQSQINALIKSICDDNRFQLTAQEEKTIAEQMLDEMLGVGPIEPLLADDSVNDILVNGHNQIFVERFGKLELTSISFIDEEHVFNTAQRIAARVGRRIDEANPMVDARLQDGSRVNVITHPLALDGTTISIRKFARRKLSLEAMAEGGALSMDMAMLLRRAMQARLNIVVSGGTGAGKTTLLNALSFNISASDRIVTIEDAAELQLQQEHVVRLETRPESIEGGGQVTQRDLLRNALRMRPDRIILGEVRGGECFDMLQAMNTGHDGSLCTVHANTPRDALMRLENMVLMANMQLPLNAIRRQIASAVDLIVQIERMRDGARRLVSIVEVCGMEEEVIQTQELFAFRTHSLGGGGKIVGEHLSSGLRPKFYTEKNHLYED
ncbi:CpaF family protein [Pseudodesulfovibrio sp. F-1]|uniref:CpaF family protein n=1 Tax=Pseudodesulfovibrio alkaliphilus TaxID=2661613 RepID=A0A7K1KR18_9BACT|nr:CpaF family protein [Pseudodesulfovibrio alkaliphilus]MUM78533.1 CpaF family protein [Pseudodesulfovibrio alkaliphilus]